MTQGLNSGRCFKIEERSLYGLRNLPNIPYKKGYGSLWGLGGRGLDVSEEALPLLQADRGAGRSKQLL